MGETSTGMEASGIYSLVRPVSPDPEPTPPQEPVYLLFIQILLLNGVATGCGTVVPVERAWRMLERARKNSGVRGARLIELGDGVREIEREDQLQVGAKAGTEAAPNGD